MATIVATVDRTTVNYEDIFVYIINISFNGVVGSIDSAYLKIFFPDTIEYMPGGIQEPVKEARTEVVPGGTNLIFDFGSIEDLGVAVRIALGARYTLDGMSGTTYTAQPELWINDVLEVQSATAGVALQAVPQFEILREVVLPAIEPAPGGAVYYKVTLENFGDKGVRIDNVVIEVPSVDGMTLDETYNPGGFDQSQERFVDTSQDGLLAVIQNNTLTFTMPTYRGYKYEFYYKGIISSDLDVGEDLTTVASFTVDSEPQASDINVIQLDEPIYSATINKYGPQYTLPGEPISYELTLINDGNQELTAVYLVDELPNSIQYESFRTGTFKISGINQDVIAEYVIDYSTVNGIIGTLGPFMTDVNNIVDLNTIIAEGDNLATLSWNLQQLGLGVTQKTPPHINGHVKQETFVGTSILNHFHLHWQVEGVQQASNINFTTLVQNFCVLTPLFKQIDTNQLVRPGEKIRYEIGFNCRQSRLANPLLAMLLPPEIEYVGNITARYNDYFNEQPAPQTPPVIVIPNFKDTGQTLVKFVYDGDYSYDFNQKMVVRIQFDTRVKIGVRGEVVAKMLLNTVNNNGIIPSGYNLYQDTLNIAEDSSVSPLYVASNEKSNQILIFISVDSDKKVKGALDTEFHEEPTVGRTLEGGLVEYKISITNVGNVDLESVDIVDIMPHIGDYGVVEVNTPRLSAFAVYSINEIKAEVTPQLPDQPTPEIEVLYSKSYDPVRFGNVFNEIGTVDDWTDRIPSEATEVKAFRIKTKNTVIYPTQTLTVHIYAAVPVGVVAEDVAWNTFAADVTHFALDGTLQHLLAIEPEKVGIEVVNPLPGTGQIGGFVWFDEDKDGFYNDESQGMNDIGVVLYDESGSALKAVFTTPNSEGLPGYYLFNNLEIGKYYVKFFIDTDQDQFTVQRLGVERGSKANATTGVVPLIDLNIESSQRNIDAGVISIDYLKKVMEVNDSARRMMRNVIYNQMLIGMKYEDVHELIDQSE